MQLAVGPHITPCIYTCIYMCLPAIQKHYHGDLLVYMIRQEYRVAHQPVYSLSKAAMISTHPRGSDCGLQIMDCANSGSSSGSAQDANWD